MQERVFGFDIGTTSIGFAVVDHDPDSQSGRIHRLGVRIFPETRDPDGTPLNQQRRAKRMMRRQLRRRRQRRRSLNEALQAAGLLPRFDRDKASAWSLVMKADPYDLRRRGLTEALTAHELGRALYHLAKRRHFRGRDLAETAAEDEATDEKEAASNRESTLAALKREGATLGAWLANKPHGEKRRGIHADRQTVAAEFEALWVAQAPYHPVLQDERFKEAIAATVFFQRPVFWRTNTLGTCRFMPNEPLCAKGSWLSQQRRMLEKLNNLTLAGGNQRQLDGEERAAILAKLQTQGAMTWTGVRAALKPLYAVRGERGAEKGLVFNLELGGDKGLLGNKVEAGLAKIFGDDWRSHPQKQAIRDAAYDRLGGADYGRTSDGKRVVILSETERRTRREAAAQTFVADFGASQEQATVLQGLTFQPGWEPFSTAALGAFLPILEDGIRMGELLNGPDYEHWRDEAFPNRERPTGEILDLLPSPKNRDEQERIAKLRNPTVVRVQNELRKVVNNLIRAYGKPDRIRVELAREVGKSKREREEDQKRNRKNEAERKKAELELKTQGIAEPSRDDIEKWRLWHECGKCDPYSGEWIGFDGLFRSGLFQVEHIFPRSKSFDDGFGNKTLCHRDWNLRKNNRLPYEAFIGDEWIAMKDRMWRHVKEGRMSKGKAVRFCREEALDNDFVTRQLNDTGYATRQAVAFLKRLWPDVGPEAPVTVQAVSGRVTAQIRKLWGLNNILSDDGEKTRADHRHHAVDALVVACTHPGMTQRLSRFWQDADNPSPQRPRLPPPWSSIRADADAAAAEIIVSHRVRKKVSGPLHRETTYGDTEENVTTKNGVYRQFVTRKKVEALTKGELENIRDDEVRRIIKAWVAANGGDPKKAFAAYPRLGPRGPEIRKVRLATKQQLNLMAPASTGYADLGANHHIAIYRKPDGKTDFEVVSLYQATRRLARHEPAVRRDRGDGSTFVMSLAPGDAVEFPNGERRGIRIVQGVWASGQVVMLAHTDAAGGSVWRPNAGSLLSNGARKISLDPIGRVRPAAD